jgi:hypothetical protein
MKKLLILLGAVLVFASRAPAAEPLPCYGDCNGDGAVAIGEIVTCVRIALEIAPLADCPDADGDDDGRVAINELIRTVAVALGSDVPFECDARRCEATGGSVAVGLCCRTTGDFPDTCAVGACGCAPEESHEVAICSCGEGQCFDGASCVAAPLP